MSVSSTNKKKIKTRITTKAKKKNRWVRSQPSLRLKKKNKINLIRKKEITLIKYPIGNSTIKKQNPTLKK
jgi:hypothetical protein